MTLIKRDQNEGRYLSILRLPKQSNPDYYTMLFKNAKFLFIGMGRQDLVDDLNEIIREKIEVPMGVTHQRLLHYYKNLPYLNSFTRSKNPMYEGVNIEKYQIMEWLDEIETWVFQRMAELEKEIRFTGGVANFI